MKQLIRRLKNSRSKKIKKEIILPTDFDLCYNKVCEAYRDKIV